MLLTKCQPHIAPNSLKICMLGYLRVASQWAASLNFSTKGYLLSLLLLTCIFYWECSVRAVWFCFAPVYFMYLGFFSFQSKWFLSQLISYWQESCWLSFFYWTLEASPRWKDWFFSPFLKYWALNAGHLAWDMCSITELPIRVLASSFSFGMHVFVGL